MKKDIFDKIMHLPVFRIFESTYKIYKELILYLFFGGLTFLISVLTFALFHTAIGINELLANVYSWIIAVLFAFVTNRSCVFAASTADIKELAKQTLSFLLSRVITLVIEELILFIFITEIGFPSIVIKVIAQVIVIFLNYLFSKYIVFKNK